MNDSYKVLKKQTFSKGNYRIVPIRMEDRYAILQWRNEQLFHLRQNRPLSKKEQDAYFSTVVANLFSNEQPDQILFSYLEGDTCIGYGGLVHINWTDQNAEISFITNTMIDKKRYAFQMSTFLTLIAEVGYKELGFHKLFTYAFDVRPEIYPILEENGFKREAVLKEHCLISGAFKDVIIHTRFNTLEKT
ncbi:GNAT family N-acetyltransferase [Pareuzebyella sediminis]|uniref:GNAT family N-acetyltransferase n=1 Tax=Pareuzebyella sediminis TaxID=2607998 RepID=UPI0011ECC4A3|nr:GNAT family N-acetyltransferase [Pareuzebyella sediminis]